MGRRVYIDNKPLEEARALLWQELEEVGFFKQDTEEIEVADALGRITAAPVVARISSPHYSASAMDGIAVRARDTFAASDVSPVVLKRGEQFVEVDTGDLVPRDFDAVIMIEDVNFLSEDEAEIIAPAVPWQHIRSVGEDVIASQIIVPSFHRVNAYDIGAMMTSGVAKVLVVKRPSVSIIPTGTELVEPQGREPEPGQIIESNSRMLAALCREWGAEPFRHPLVVDNKETIREAVLSCVRDSDIIVVCSGSSAGREDFTAEIIGEVGRLLVHGLATRPGKPAILGTVQGKPVIGVPGYPVSAALVFELLARPLIYRKQGLPVPSNPEVEARVVRKLASNMGVDEYVQVNLGKVGGELIAYPLGRGAGLTSTLVKADGIIKVPRGVEGFEAGEKVMVSLRRGGDVIEKTLMVIGSHDIALDWLGEALNRKWGIRLACTNVGSMGGIVALKRRETHFAGMHLLDPDTGEYNVNYVKKFLAGDKPVLVNVVLREQGLLVKKGNPLGIQGIEDLTRPGIRYINRQRGSGTRVLLDHLLGRGGIDKDRIYGYDREEFSHLAVAAAVKSDAADVGLGIYAAARALHLEFIPVAQERYDLCFLEDLVTEELLGKVLEVLTSKEFRDEVLGFGGYDLSLAGQVLWKEE